MRLLDLALSYALDNPAIHMNDPLNLESLREMHVQVLRADMRDQGTVTLGDDNAGFRGPAFDEPI